MFINRNNELLVLQNDFEKPYATLNYIFGKRSSGKTYLINQYSKNKKILYISSFESTKDLFFINLKRIVDNFFNINNQVIINTSFELFKYISDQKIEDKLIFVIEDISDLLNVDKNFVNDLLLSWNKYLKNLNIQLILTSSTYSSLNNESSIKVDNIINLKNLNYSELKQVLPNTDEDTLKKVYSVFDTNIAYLDYYNEDLDFYKNIENIFLKNNSPLFKIGVNWVKNELSDISTYLAILHAVSMGNSKIGDIASFINLKSTYITRYMQKLVDIMILEKKFPINDDPEKSKFSRYEFTDNLMKFWFCFIYTNSDLINQNRSIEVLEKIKSEMFSRILVDTYKKIMMDDIEGNYSRILGYKPIKLSSWWNNKDINIDLIAYNSKYITFIDCFKDKNLDLETLEKELILKSKNFKTTLTKKYMIY